MEAAAFFIPEQGLLIVFAVVLLVLAGILFRAYLGDIRHTCLLCGDSIAAMRMGDEGDESEVPEVIVDGKKQRPNLGGSIIFNLLDRMILTIAGAFAGIIGVAIGEISNTFLSIRKKVPIKIATGTAAFVLYITILPALAANLAVIFGDFKLINAENIVIPWKIAFFLAPVVIMGGQIGSMLNSKLSDHMLAKLMMIACTLVGAFVLFNVVCSW
jgi:uncharacterized membrane protein YfcA